MKNIAIVLTAFLLIFSSCAEEAHTDGQENENVNHATVSGGESDQAGVSDVDEKTTANPSILGDKAKTIKTDKETPAAQLVKGTSGRLLNMHVEGMVIGGGRANVVLRRLGLNDRESIASNTATHDGRWGFDTKISTPSVFSLSVPAGSIHFVAYPGDTIFITSDLQTVKHYEVEGSPSSVQLLEMYYILEKANEKKDEVEHEIDEAIKKNDQNEKLRLYELKPLRYSAIEEQKHKDLRNFIKRIDLSFTAILAALYLDPADQKDFEVIEEVVNKFSPLYPDNEYLIGLKGKMDVYLPVSIGRIAPEIAMSTPKGKDIRLSDYRGKYVLIDFWASWCKPCRVENPRMKKVYEKYKNKGKGFEIFGVSIDDDRSDWVKAIEEDGLPWVHASDLQGNASTASQTYLVSEVPTTYLLDPEGRILAKNLRSAELDKKLAELLK